LGAGEDQVRSGGMDALISGDPTAPKVEFRDQLDTTVATALDGLIKQKVFEQALAGTGADPATVSAKVAAASFHPVALDPNAAQQTQRIFIGVFVAVLLFVSLQLYGQFVASGIVEEKASRVIEIILSTVRPRQMLFGKVVGIGLIGFSQLVLLGAVALVAVLTTQVISVPNIGVTAVLGSLLWFVLGFFFYALIYASAGSLASRQEELQAVTAPVTILLVGPYIAMFWVVANPDNPIGAVLSMLPPFAPVMMPSRMATGNAQAWQVVIAVVLMLAAIVGMNALAARIYSNSVLRTGSRVRLVDALRGRI
jgi:ABC-2 type transport system permease protein